MKKIFSMIALMLMAVTGAWADGTTYTVQFKANNKTKTVENVTLPHTFSCDYMNENGELDLIIKELYEFSTGYCDINITPTTSGSESVTAGKSGNDQYITISTPFEGTATVSGVYQFYTVADFRYSLEISIPSYVAPAATTYNVTIAEGTEDAANWTITPTSASEGATVTLKYNGTKNVKSFKAVKKAAAAEGHALSESVVGEIVGSDGMAYAVADKDNLPSGVTAVAMVAYVGNASDCSHGLAIALADESTNGMNWADANSTCSGKTAVTGGTWHLPSITDWQNMFIGCGASGTVSDAPSNMSYSELASKLKTAGGTALQPNVNYWSSTFYMGAYYKSVHFSGDEASWTMNMNFNSIYVRACLAF